MAIPVITPTRQWASRLAAERECTQILRASGYNLGDTVSDPNHAQVLTGLVQIHPHAADKIGGGIDHFKVENVSSDPGQDIAADSRGFVLYRTDGTRVDFSFMEAIYPSDQKKRVTTALKAEVEDLRLAFRDARFASGRANSDISGLPFPSRASASVIYENPAFAQLAYRFAESEGGWNSVDTQSGGASAYIGESLVDPAVRQRWRAFYQAHARPKLATRSEGASRRRVDETAWRP